VLDGIYRTTVDGQLLAANPALVRMLGYVSEEELREADVGSDLYAEPNERERLQAQLVSEGATRNVEINVKRRDGSVITVLDNSHLVRNDAGEVLYSEGTLTDISALKARERELQEAYDATIEGWSRAMDLRDRETQGHTQRVAYVTEKMAREFGVPEDEVVHIRRGALLHDIGKMGIPDNVLRKTGTLTGDEWEVMRQHPQYAQDMLWPIKYLRPALAIPYCHHEKWDGSGYPRGLKGVEIPLAARLFAVADVWDALRSDRPYRQAWSEAKVLDYIHEQAGRHFDPQVAGYFLENVNKFKLETATLVG
jgi:PAS domain S-box-containing protein/putative nucleotidyltransferase with HDIG domain